MGRGPTHPPSRRAGKPACWRAPRCITSPSTCSKGLKAITSGSSGPCRGGSVRTRASKYRLSWDEANPGSRGLQDGQHGHTPPEKEQSAAIGGNMLVGGGGGGGKGAEVVVGLGETGGWSGGLEGPHRAGSGFDGAGVPLPAGV